MYFGKLIWRQPTSTLPLLNRVPLLKSNVDFQLEISSIQPILNSIPEHASLKNVKVTMKAHAALLSLAISLSLSSAVAAASATVSDPAGTKRASGLATQLSKPTPGALSTAAHQAAGHLFPVMDEKGPLLTCVAPELDTNRETDVFKDCTLAPGRTLDDVMHAFIRGIHEEQHQRMKERADLPKDPQEKADGASTQK
jgi:hypothetical protein